MKQKKDCIDKLLQQIEVLEMIPDYLVDTITDYEISYGPHTLLKLSVLNYYTGIFLPVAGKAARNYGGRTVFIDALAGTGIVQVEDIRKNKPYFVRGSSLISALGERTVGQSKYRFDTVYSVEYDQRRYKLLEERFELIRKNDGKAPELYAYWGDVNKKISEIAEDIHKNDYIVLFIDPEGITEVQLDSFNDIFTRSKRIDVMLNYSYIGTLRVLGAGLQETVKNFVPTHTPDKDPLDAIKEYFESIGKEQQVIVSIRSKGQKEEYKIFLGVRNTRGRSSFLKGFKPFADCIDEEIDGDTLRKSIEFKGGLFRYSEKN